MAEIKKLYLVRHGETLFNTKHIVQGTCDSPLTAKGHQQARAAKQILLQNNIKFDHAYCSMLHRTEETIQEITTMPYERREELNERCYGTMEGESTKIAENFKFEERSQLYELCGGETKEHLIHRMNSFLTDIMSNEDHHSVLCVSHGAAISYFMFHIDPDFPIHSLQNCHILELEFDGKFHFIKDYVSKNG